MTDDSAVRVHRIGPVTRKLYPLWLFGGTGFGIGLIAQLYVLVVHGVASVLILFNLAVVASVILGFVSTRRAMTTITPDHIEVRTLRGIHRIHWEDIQQIELRGPERQQTVLVRGAPPTP